MKTWMGVVLAVPAGILTWLLVGSIPNMMGNYGGWAALFVLFIGPAAGIGAGTLVIQHFARLEEEAEQRRERRIAEANHQQEEAKRQEEKAKREEQEAKRLLKEKAERQAALLERHKEEQLNYRRQMIALAEQSLVLFESIPDHLSSAEVYLDQAEVEFIDRAFAPFWDCIENAVDELGRIDAGARQIKDNSSRYDEVVKNYENSPPRFTLERESVTKLGVASASAERMQDIVRKAQRDFQFATIYEQRKTNQILVAGFTNLAQGINNMTWQITFSIDELAKSVDETASTLDESLDTISSRVGFVGETVTEASVRSEKALGMLDNIQRGRRPAP